MSVLINLPEKIGLRQYDLSKRFTGLFEATTHIFGFIQENN